MNLLPADPKRSPRFAAALLCGALLFATALSARGQAAGGPSGEDRPNVLFILVDDLRPLLGAYGHPDIHSPHIDKLAEEGLLFERAYTQQAVCAPSRISLMSGLRPDSAGVYGLGTPLREAMPEVVTLPQHFKQHGYTTVPIYGKVYHHRDDDPQGWTRQVHVEGDWKGRGYLAESSLEMMRQNESNSEKGPAYEAAAVPDTAYEDGKVARAAIQELHRLQDAPFFLAVGFKKPHLPFVAPKKYWDHYPPERIQMPENYFEPSGLTPYSLTNFGELRSYAGIPGTGPVPYETAWTLNRGYRACVSYIDAQVGRVLGELERLGLRENTIIVLWGDHGFKLGEHASWSKHTNTEIDARIPLIVSAPGMEGAGQRTEALVETIDIYPTLAELAGLPAPPQAQGTSFAPLLDAPNRAWKKAAFHVYPRWRQRGMAYEDPSVFGTAVLHDDASEEQAAGERPNAVTVPEAGQAPIIDGQADAAWEQASAQPFEYVIAGSADTDDDLSGTWKALWDEEALYYLVEVADDVRVEPAPDGFPGEGDAVELFIDPDYSRGTDYDDRNDVQYGLGRGAARAVAGRNSIQNASDVEVVSAETEAGYRLEVAVPWSALGVAPVAGHRFGTEVQLSDNDGGENRDGKRAWAATEQEGTLMMGRAIRTARYHYIEWQLRDTGAALMRELYDHRTDPQENVNVAQEPSYAETIQKLSRQLAAGGRAARPDEADPTRYNQE